VIALLRLGHQVVHIHKRLADGLRQSVFVAIGKVRQIPLKLHRKQHQLAVQAGLGMDGLMLCHGDWA
jgi:hypothetical protein